MRTIWRDVSEVLSNQAAVGIAQQRDTPTVSFRQQSDGFPAHASIRAFHFLFAPQRESDLRTRQERFVSRPDVRRRPGGRRVGVREAPT